MPLGLELELAGIEARVAIGEQYTSVAISHCNIDGYRDDMKRTASELLSTQYEILHTDKTYLASLRTAQYSLGGHSMTLPTFTV